MKKVLLPVDGSLDSLAAVWHVIREAGRAGPSEIHLLNVQQRGIAEESMIAVPVEDIDSYYLRRSIKALECAERSLNDAGIECIVHRMVGPVAESILEKQRELGCGSIVMSTHRPDRDSKVVSGTVSTHVRLRAKVPVTLVEAGRPGAD